MTGLTVQLGMTWKSATAMVANLLEFLELPPGSRIAVQVDKSVEALVSVLGHAARRPCVYLPLNTAYQSAEIEPTFSDDAEARRGGVCGALNFG